MTPDNTVEKEPLFCPQCQEPLAAKDFYGVEVDTCAINGCGTWFDYHEMDAIAHSADLAEIDSAFEGEFKARPPIEAIKNDKPYRCPHHKIDMNRYEWSYGSGIVLDSCPECNGIWADAGELEAYTAAVLKAETEKPEMTFAIKGELDLAESQVRNHLDDAYQKFAVTRITRGMVLFMRFLAG
ncbi:MAG: zf-TFIIB domain-containing protein [Cyanobacteria bacterium]|nr:zf-TFIIB domain-containing protein [Cyanobacteriota bacterium]